jgi:hypothetical protein
MAYKTIGQLDAAASAESADLIEIEQSGVSKYASIDQILNNEGRLMSASGIKFPAVQVPSADANTLDGYEEGTFTPALVFGTSASGMTFTTQLGNYTRIGNMVFIRFQITLSAKGTSTGNAVFTNLPFVGVGNSSLVWSLHVNISSTGIPSSRTNGGASTASLFTTDDAGTRVAMSNSNFTDTSSVTISGCYSV